MDRQQVFIGQTPEDTDLLLTNKNAYIGLAKACAAILGTSTLLNNFVCTQTGTPSMAVVISAGEIYSLQNIDNTAYGSVPSDTTHSIVKQGIILDSTTLPLTAPVTVGFSVNYLIQIGFSETDTGSTVLPYYNSSNPSVPFSGPNNNGQPNNTIRKNGVNISAKAGTPAATGTQTTPSADAGFTGAYVVTIAQGATTVVNGNISLYAGAPFITETLTQKISQTFADARYLQAGSLQNNSSNYAADTGSVNAYAMTLSPVPGSYVTGEFYFIKITNTNTSSACTLNVNSLGAKNIKLPGGNNINVGDLVAGTVAILTYNGTNLELENPASIQSQIQKNTLTYAADSGSANAYAVTLAPAPTAYTTGMTVISKLANSNTGSSTLNVNSLGTKNIVYSNGNSVVSGDLPANMLGVFNYDGTSFQLLNPPMSLQKVSVATASTSASISFTNLGTLYRSYLLIITGIIPTGSSTGLQFTMSTNNGSTYLNTSYGYQFTGSQTGANTTTVSAGNNNTSSILIDLFGTLSQNNTAGQIGNYVMHIFNANTSNRCMISYQANFIGSTGALANIVGCGQQFGSTAINAVSFAYGSTTIASGSFELYGVLA